MFLCFSDVTTSSTRTSRRQETHCQKEATQWTSPHRMMELECQHRFPFFRKNPQRVVVTDGLSCVFLHTQKKLRRHCEKNNTIKMFCLPLTQMRDHGTDIVRTMGSQSSVKPHEKVCFEVCYVENNDKTWPRVDLKRRTVMFSMKLF